MQNYLLNKDNNIYIYNFNYRKTYLKKIILLYIMTFFSNLL